MLKALFFIAFLRNNFSEMMGSKNISSRLGSRLQEPKRADKFRLSRLGSFRSSLWRKSTTTYCNPRVTFFDRKIKLGACVPKHNVFYQKKRIHFFGNPATLFRKLLSACRPIPKVEVSKIYGFKLCFCSHLKV